MWHLPERLSTMTVAEYCRRSRKMRESRRTTYPASTIFWPANFANPISLLISGRQARLTKTSITKTKLSSKLQSKRLKSSKGLNLAKNQALCKLLKTSPMTRPALTSSKAGQQTSRWTSTLSGCQILSTLNSGLAPCRWREKSRKARHRDRRIKY